MSIFDKFKPLNEQRQQLQQLGMVPFGQVTDRLLSPTEAMMNGRPTVLAGTNNYLGLTFNEECIEAACKALREQGTGTTGSRMANGTFADHIALEQDLCRFFQCQVAIVFSTGYLANLGMLSTLVDKDDVLMIDSDCHASIYEGCRASNAEMIRFRHNDPEDLDKRIRRLKGRAKNVLILTEGLYSMLGDTAPLKEIVEVKKRHGAYLLVDEAHSLGVLGEHGRGLAEHLGVEEDVDFIVGTFSKSLGGIGGYCVSRLPEVEIIRYAIRQYIFTASPSPATIASTRVALRLLENGQDRRKQLWDNAARLYNGIKDLGFTVGPEIGPVVAVLMENEQMALHFWQHLLNNGVYVNLVLPPGAPNGGSLLRCSVSAGHSPEQVDRIVAGFAALKSG